ncbi:hypothetical protein IEQ34_022947 [Dendrobium chrysotoxum]|uniref:Uncharacterized protein n=1 Tax=Dendrobium chrysotoxum TaxID=161865 RepID=A0AAV7G0W0_DENCH|nr:hypothetical protein IEQ34_022947 [Dendrobium chrysotoxum]
MTYQYSFFTLSLQVLEFTAVGFARSFGVWPELKLEQKKVLGLSVCVGDVGQEGFRHMRSCGNGVRRSDGCHDSVVGKAEGGNQELAVVGAGVYSCRVC